MWFDVQAALAEIGAGKKPAPEPAPPATHAICATQAPAHRPHVAQVARPPTQTPQLSPCASDAETYLSNLRASGPQSYGAAAAMLGWGATRAWQAEARLRAAGLVVIDKAGKAVPFPMGEAKWRAWARVRGASPLWPGDLGGGGVRKFGHTPQRTVCLPFIRTESHG